MNQMDIAECCYEVHRAVRLAHGDISYPPWPEAPQWLRSLAARNVELHLMNPAAGPELLHEDWKKRKQADGWMYGPLRSDSRHQHPAIKSFAELPVDMKAKDWAFRAVVQTLRKHLVGQ